MKEIKVEYGKNFGGTTYMQSCWGVNIYADGQEGHYRWVGWPIGSLKEAREEAKRQYVSRTDGEKVTLSLKARKYI